MNVKPLYDKVLVKRVENESVTAGGIIITDTAQEKTQIGIVEAVGEGKILTNGKLSSPKVKTDDRVVFGRYSGIEFKFKGQEYLILREDEIIGIIDEIIETKDEH